MLCKRAISNRSLGLLGSKRLAFPSSRCSPERSPLDRSRDNCFHTPQSSLLTGPATHIRDATFDSKNVLGVMEGCGSWSSKLPHSFTRNALRSVCSSISKKPEDLLFKTVTENLPKEMPFQPKFCIVQRDNKKIRAVTFGDSGFMILRNNKVIFRSDPQSILFGDIPALDDPDEILQYARQIELTLKDGDMIVIGSDGLFDNLFDDEIEKIVMQSPGKYVAKNLASAAMSASYSTSKSTPFSERINEETDQVWRGGKPDDVAVVVSKI